MTFELPGHGSFSRPLVVGAARSGVAAAKLMLALGAPRVAVADARGESELGPVAEELRATPGVVLHAGGHPPELADDADLVVVSPGVPLERPVFARARERGVPVLAEVEVAFPFLKGRIAGITGSNGKSTVTALVAAIGRQAGLSSEPAGNFGPPLSGFAGADVDLLAVELSSFQLEAIDRFRPAAAILLNVTPDHLDRYPSLDAYGDAKARIFRSQLPTDAAVVNADDPRTAAAPSAARRYAFSRLHEVPAGAFVRAGILVFRDLDGREEEILPAADVRIPGPHNLENALAAVAAAGALGLPAPAVARALATFPGLPHRCEPVGEIGDVAYVNDSKGTNVDAALTAFASFSHRNVWFILGGRDKAGDFPALAARVAAAPTRTTVLAVGEAAPRVVAAMKSAGVAVIDCGTIPQAVDTAQRQAAPGDVVLLSPACASFDQFRNYEHRGEEFRRIVQERMHRTTDRTVRGH